MIRQKQKPKEEAQGLVPMYWHFMPKWMIFLMFLKRGFFNGFVHWDLKRVFCWYGKHDWNIYKYYKWENQAKTNKYKHQCRRCCMQSIEYKD